MTEYIDKQAFKNKYLCCGYLPEMSEVEFDAFPVVNMITKEQFGFAEQNKCNNLGEKNGI